MSRAPTTDPEAARGRRLGGALADLRARAGWTQERLSREADVSVDTIRRLERGVVPTPGFFIVAKLARALDASVDELLLRVPPDG